MPESPTASPTVSTPESSAISSATLSGTSSGTSSATSSGPPRADARIRELITTFRSYPDDIAGERALDEVARLTMPLARSLAHRYGGRGLDREDLEQVAFLALLKAVHRFDLDKPTEFGAYATPTITGELRRHFRDHGWLVRPPRELQERRQRVATTRVHLEQELGHEPTEEEIAQELELSVDAVREADVAAANLRPASLDAPIGDGRSTVDTLEGLEHEPHSDGLDGAIVVRSAIARLDAREQALVELRFAADLTQAEIADVMGLSAMQVSRLLRRVLEGLRDQLADEGVVPA